MPLFLKRSLLLGFSALAALAAGGATRVALDQCGPFADVSPAMCPYVLEMYYLGITVGTSPTTYSPDNAVTRGQAAVFVSKGVNQAISRSSRRAALGQWWTSQGAQSLTAISLSGGTGVGQVRSDGADLWVAVRDGTVNRVRASDGRVLETWTGASKAKAVLVAIGRIFVVGNLISGAPSKLHMIDPSQPPGTVATVATELGPGPSDIAFDGARIWTANEDATVSIVTPSASLPWSVTNVTVGTYSHDAIFFDGSNMWVSDGPNVDRLDSNGAVVQSVAAPVAGHPAFDGENLWFPGRGDQSIVTVVRASTGEVLATLTGNGLNAPSEAAFDGTRVLVTNDNLGAGNVSLWNAADLTALGSVFTNGGAGVVSACSDGLNFWISEDGNGPQLERF